MTLEARVAGDNLGPYRSMKAGSASEQAQIMPRSTSSTLLLPIKKASLSAPQASASGEWNWENVNDLRPDRDRIEVPGEIFFVDVESCICKAHGTGTARAFIQEYRKHLSLTAALRFLFERREHVQKSDTEYSHNPNFAPQVHLQIPYKWQRKQQDIEVTDHVEDSTEVRHDVKCVTFARQHWLEALLYWSALV